MNRKKVGTLFTVILITIALQGCSQTSEPNIAKNGETNQSVQFSNVNIVNTVGNASDNPGSNTSLTNGNLAPTVNRKPVSKMPEPKIGNGGNDLSVLLLVRGKLNSDKDLINSVIVEVAEGNATLTGKVSNEEQKKKAEELTKSVEGVKTVKNNLQVSH